MMKTRLHFALPYAVFFLCLGLSACEPESEPEKVSLSYLGVNHTDESVVSIIVNGVGGILDAPAQGGGGAQICCVMLPKRWRPGLTTEIKWQVDGDWLTDDKGKEVLRDGRRVYVPKPYKTQIVEVPQYTDDELGHFDIHIMPGDKVLVKVSSIFPEHPKYVPAYPKQKN